MLTWVPLPAPGGPTKIALIPVDSDIILIILSSKSNLIFKTKKNISSVTCQFSLLSK